MVIFNASNKYAIRYCNIIIVPFIPVLTDEQKSHLESPGSDIYVKTLWF